MTSKFGHQISSTDEIEAVRNLKLDRSSSKTTDDSGYTDEERAQSSSDEDEYDYHYVEALKVIGVHKQERPKVDYLFVIIVRWNDKSQVTIYRKWVEIKEFQVIILKDAKKNHNGDIKSRHFIKKTGKRVKNAARFRKGTIKKLDMIDSLNQYFEALLSCKESNHRAVVRKFFKPTDSDLNSIAWSGEGRTYFYVTRDILGERNSGFDLDNDDELDFDVVAEECIIDASKHMNADGTALQHTEEEFNDAMEKYQEADPNISWPIKSNIYIALCDFITSGEDPKENIIGLTKGEEVDVLNKDESGWWMVSRTHDNPNTKNGLNECGYVPAGYLQPKEKKLLLSKGSFLLKRNSSSFSEIQDDASSTTSKDIEDCDDVKSSKDSISAESSDQTPSDDTPSPPRRRFLPRSATIESYDSTISDLALSTESISTISRPPTPKPRAKTLAFIDKCNVSPISPLAQNNKSFTPTPHRRRIHSARTHTSDLGSKTPPISQRSATIGAFYRLKSPLSQDLSDSGSAEELNQSSSSLFSTKPGVDYVAIKDFNGSFQDELSFQKGVILKILRRNANGWWLASYHGKSGLVPAVNLKRYRDPIRTMSIRLMDNF